jgi:hypothetical protein
MRWSVSVYVVLLRRGAVPKGRLKPLAARLGIDTGTAARMLQGEEDRCFLVRYLLPKKSRRKENKSEAPVVPATHAFNRGARLTAFIKFPCRPTPSQVGNGMVTAAEHHHKPAAATDAV